MNPKIDHVQITVKDLDAATPFYDGMMRVLGFDVERKVSATIEKHDFRVVEYLHPNFSFAITSPRTAFAEETVHRRKPGAMHHIAFTAESREEVDEAWSQLERIGAKLVDGPKLWPEHGPDYYAVFFKDPDGLKFEIVNHPRLT